MLVMILSTLFAFAGSYYFYYEELQISKLDLHKTFDDNYFSKPKFPSDDIVLTINKEEKEKLGLFEVTLINYTTKNYLDIPVNLKIIPKDEAEFKILAYSAVGQNEVYDLVEETKKMKFDGNSYNFSYKVSSINRTEKNDYSMQLRILFEGTDQPEVKVVAKGVGIRDFDINNSPYQKNVNIQAVLIVISGMVGFILVLLALMTLIFNPLISLLTKKMAIKNNQKYAQELVDVIKNNKLQPDKTDEEISNFVADMLFKRQDEWWRNKTPIEKWSLGPSKPDRSDYLVEK